MKLEFSRRMFEKSSNIKFHKRPFSASRVVPCGRTDVHEANSLDLFHPRVANSQCSQFCRRAKKCNSSPTQNKTFALYAYWPVKVV